MNQLSFFFQTTLWDLYQFVIKAIYTKNNYPFLNLKDDLSYKRDAYQSHTNNKFIASNAVDKNTTTCMRTESIGNNSPNKTVWWKLDLGGVYNIYKISILFKNYDNFGIYCLCFLHCFHKCIPVVIPWLHTIL